MAASSESGTASASGRVLKRINSENPPSQTMPEASTACGAMRAPAHEVVGYPRPVAGEVRHAPRDGDQLAEPFVALLVVRADGADAEAERAGRQAHGSTIGRSEGGLRHAAGIADEPAGQRAGRTAGGQFVLATRGEVRAECQDDRRSSPDRRAMTAPGSSGESQPATANASRNSGVTDTRRTSPRRMASSSCQRASTSVPAELTYVTPAKSMLERPHPVLMRSSQGGGEMLGPLPIEASLQLRGRAEPPVAGGVDLHFLAPSRPRPSLASFTRSGGRVTPILLASAGLTASFVVCTR